jgi:type I restriction enzyme S subunit
MPKKRIEDVGGMSKVNKKKTALVPQLRFSEFRDKGEWEKKQLGDLSEVKASGDIDTALFSNLRSTTHLYPVYSNAVENEGLYGYYSVPQYKKNSVTITARGTLGVAFLRDHEFMGIGRLIVVSDLCGLDACFLKECWNHLALIPSEVTSIPQLTAVAVRATILPIPSFAEQQRIADCLSSLDNLIAAGGRKLAALRDHKRGLMQQLFPREGETVPRLRFPEFRDKGEWEVDLLGNICEFQDGFAFSSDDFVDLSTDAIQVVRITDINNGNKNKDKVYFPLSKIENMSLDKYLVNTGDLLLSLTGAAGFNFLLWNFEKALINQRTMKISIKPGNSNALKTLLEPFLYEKINIHGTGQNNNLSKEILKSVAICFPKEPAEQQRIADYLSSLDELIVAKAKKVELLKQHKKGLMQQLFPSPEEVET